MMQCPTFSRWLSLERKYAFEKIDAILLENEGLQACPLNPDILRCVDEFIGLLQILVARCVLGASALQCKPMTVSFSPLQPSYFLVDLTQLSP